MRRLIMLIENASSFELENGTRLFRNPSKTQFWALLDRSLYKSLRGVLTDTGDVWVWNAAHKTHDDIWKETGIMGKDFGFDKNFPSRQSRGYVTDLRAISPLIASWYEGHDPAEFTSP